jgi:hypothetical protein
LRSETGASSSREFCNEKSSRSVLRVLLAEESASEDFMCNNAVKISVVHVSSVNV